MKNRTNLTHEELCEYLLALSTYATTEMMKIISLYEYKEGCQLLEDIPFAPLFKFMTETMSGRMLTGDKNTPLMSTKDKDGLVRVFYQCLKIEPKELDEDEKKFLEAQVEQFLEQELSGENFSSLNYTQAWTMTEASIQASVTNNVSLCDPISLQEGWNESIRVKYPTKELFISESRKNALNNSKTNAHSFVILMKVIEVLAKRAYGE
jgi:hypothetical protein